VNINPSEVGYQVECLRAEHKHALEDLTGATSGRIAAIVAGGSMFAAQFPEWRAVAANADIAQAGDAQIAAVAQALATLAVNVRKATDLFDKRIADSLAMQAEDLAPVSDQRVRGGVANSAANLFSALTTRAARTGQFVTEKATEEAIKLSVRQFMEANKPQIDELASWAPRTLAWLTDKWSELFGAAP